MLAAVPQHMLRDKISCSLVYIVAPSRFTLDESTVSVGGTQQLSYDLTRVTTALRSTHCGGSLEGFIDCAIRLPITWNCTAFSSIKAFTWIRHLHWKL